MCQWRGGTAERELGLLGRQEVAVHLVVDVDPDSAVNVHGGVGDAVAGLGRPERAVATSTIGGQVLRKPPGCLYQRQSQTLDVDVVVGQPRRDGLEAADRPVELLAGAGVLGRQLERALEHAELEGGQSQRLVGGQPRQHIGVADDAVGSDLDTGEVELARNCSCRWSATGSPIRQDHRPLRGRPLSPNRFRLEPGTRRRPARTAPACGFPSAGIRPRRRSPAGPWPNSPSAPPSGSSRRPPRGRPLLAQSGVPEPGQGPAARTTDSR